MSALASRFSRNVNVLRANSPLSDDQIRTTAPSIFAEEAHESRSGRYSYIPTSEVLRGLRKEGFEPFMVAQTRVRDESKREHTKHMIRLRHASQITGAEANEVILLNSHDGSSSYQMLAGMFRFVCANGMVCGDTRSDIRVPHKGDVAGRVIEGAFEVLDGFTRVVEERELMKQITLNDAEKQVLARVAIEAKFDVPAETAPVTEAQVLERRRFDDAGSDLWSTFNVIQENLTKGGLRGRSAAGKVITTRPVKGIDPNLKLNRLLWNLAEEMARLKG